MTMAMADRETLVSRMLDLPALLAKKSHFLFGPRHRDYVSGEATSAGCVPWQRSDPCAATFASAWRGGAARWTVS
jgi:hypothetical protein